MVSTLATFAGLPDPAASSFDKANTLLTQGAFDDALRAFAVAAKTDPGNTAYRENYAVLRRIIRMRERLDKEANPQKWETSALAIRAYYYEHAIYKEALPLDRQIHEKLNNATSAEMLAETQLNLGLNAEAAETLQQMDAKEATPRSQMLLGIALARSQKVDEARAATSELTIADKAGPHVLFDAARLKALLGDNPAAITLLVKCFESTPPSRLDAMKTLAKESPDLKGISAGPEFATALATASKVKESECSGGSSCGSCPSRASCGHSAASATSTKKD